MDRFFYGLLATFFVVSFSAIGWVGFMAFQRQTSDKVELIAHEWECTETRVANGFVMAGKVVVPTKTEVCSVYRML